ncbi:MAG: ABC transporter permease [Acidobacteriia bacterium]|nr:ABC transporter permease [Terriglobia bacterium]
MNELQRGIQHSLGNTSMNQLVQDLRYALRTLRKGGGTALIITLSLAIGIGANAAMFSVINALLLRPLGYPDQDRLAVLWQRSPGIGISQDWPSPGEFNDLQTQNKVFDELALAIGRTATLTGLTQPERLQAVRTTSTLLDMLGAKAMIGRSLLPQEDKPGQANSAVLSFALWTRLFGSDRQVVGRSLVIDGRQYTVVGVLEPSFELNHEVLQTIGGLEKAEIFLPLPLSAGMLNDYDDENYNVLARLKPGVSLSQAQASVDIVANYIRESRHRDRTFTVSVVPILEQVVGDVRLTVLVLFGSVFLVLLIASANVANLLLLRAMGRKKEIALRTALGASRHRLIRQLLTESVVFGLLGGAGGLVVASLGLSAIRAFNPGNIPRVDQIGIDGRVLLFTLSVSLLTSLLFGLAPALQALKIDLNDALKSGGRSSQSGGGFDVKRHKLRSLLVAGELGLSLMLLVGASLLIRSFVRLLEVPPGFSPDHVISMRISLTDPQYQDASAKTRFAEDVQGQIKSLPGVNVQGVISALPLTSAAFWGTVSVEGYVPPANEPEIQADVRGISPDYFRVMKIPLIKGRVFTDSDTKDGQPVILVDDKTAQRFWPHENPIGKRIRPDDGPGTPYYSIVGVVGTVKQYGLDSSGRITLYFPYKQRSTTSLYVAARTASDPAALSSAIIRAIHSIDPNIAVYDIATMEERLQHSLARQRFSMTLLGSFAVFALILAAIGVYGVLSYAVTQGTRDIGVRIMLGAQRGSILSLVLQHGLYLTGGGILGGLIGALIMSRVMQSLLFEIGATDTFTFLLVAIFLIFVGLVASYLPARRAIRVDPMVALRSE